MLPPNRQPKKVRMLPFCDVLLYFNMYWYVYAGKQTIDDDEGIVEQIRRAIRDEDDSAKGRSA